MTLPAFKAAGVGSETAPAWPAGHAAGDFGILSVANPDTAVTTPSGWNLLRKVEDSTNGIFLYTFWRFATSGAEGAPTITGSTNHNWAQITTYTGVNTASPIHTSTSYKNANDRAPGLRTQLDDCMIVYVVGFGADNKAGVDVGSAYTNADLGSVTERYDNATNTGNGSGLLIFDGTCASKKVVGIATFTAATPGFEAVQVIALQAADKTFSTKGSFINLGQTRMAIPCKQSTAQSFRFFMADSADGKTGKTGLTLAVTLQKEGETSFSSISPTVTEIGTGHYNAALTTTHMNTVGLVSLRATATGADPADCPNCIDVIAYDKTSATRGTAGTALPDAAAAASGGLFTRGTGAGQINQDSNGRIDVRAVALDAGVITATSIASDAITAAKIASDAITAAKIAADAITAAKIATGAITAAKFAAGAIDAAAIASDAIAAAKIATGALTAAKFAADAITSTVIADNAITAAKLANDAITAAKIADNAIDRATFAQDAKDVLGEIRRFTAAGGSTTTVTFDGSAVATNDYYKNAALLCVGGAGAGQVATVASYVGATKVATLDRTVATAFDNTSVFELRASGGGGSSSGGGGSPGAVFGQYRHVASSSTLAFDFFVQKMLVDSTETDPKVGKTGLTEANFTVKSCLGGSTSFTTIADGGHAIIELGGGFYRLTAGAAADYTDEDGEAVVAIYTVTDASGGAETGLVWIERYSVGTAGVAVYAAADGARVVEGSNTHDDLIRLLVGVIAGPATDYTTNTLVFKSLNGAKTRLTVVKDATGRITITPGDLT